jgi:hypothetical protein
MSQHLIEAMKTALNAWDAYNNASDSQEDAKAYASMVVAFGKLRAAIAEAEKQPAQRQWVGLTEKDFSAINQSCLTKLQAATSAESILKEKNT